MAKTILTKSQQSLINKVITDARTGKITSANYWQQYTSEEMNLLQAVFYAVRNGEDTGEEVDNDLSDVINGLGIGMHNAWGITTLPPDYVADMLEKGLQIFK